MDYSSDESVHSILNLTFKEILLAVYQKIINHEHKLEILEILNEEMKSAECKCFTGRITRLVNCLSGFDNDVVIKIADNEQIGNVGRWIMSNVHHARRSQGFFRHLRKGVGLINQTIKTKKGKTKQCLLST